MRLLILLFLWIPSFATPSSVEESPNCAAKTRLLSSNHSILDAGVEFVVPLPNIRQRATTWTRNARSYVARMQGTAEEKVQKMRELLNAISQRAANETTKFIPSEWEALEFNAGGTTVFVGVIGHFVEIRPDGSVYKGVLNDSVVPRERFFSPHWHPVGGAQGLDPSYILVREPVK